MADLQTIISDPEFAQLDDTNKIKFLNEVSSDFSAMPVEKQNAFIEEYNTINTQPQEQIADISQETQRPTLQGGTSFTDTALDVAQEALPIVGGIVGGIAGGGTPASIPLAGIGASGGEGFAQAIEGLRGQREQGDLGKIATEGAFALGGEGLGQGLVKGAKLGAKTISPLLGNILSAIPESETQNLIKLYEQGKDVFSGKLSKKIENLGSAYKSIKETLIPEKSLIDNLGTKLKSFKETTLIPEKEITQEYFNIADNIKNILDNEKTRLGKLSGQFQKQLENTDYTVDISDLMKNISTKIQNSFFQGQSKLLDADVKEVGNIYNKLNQLIKSSELGGNNVYLGQLNNLKTQLQELNSKLWKEGGISSSGKNLIAEVIGDLRNTVYKNAPDTQLFEANEAFHNYLKNVYDPLVDTVKSKNSANFLKNIDLQPTAQRQALEELNSISGNKLVNEILGVKQKSTRNSLLNDLISNTDIKNPLNILNKNYNEIEKIRELNPNLIDEIEKLGYLNKNNKELASLIKDTDIKNPLNILNKSSDDLERIKELSPELYQNLLDIRTRATFERPFAFQSSPYITNRIEQQQTIEQINFLKSLLGLGGLATGGTVGGALGLAGTTAIQSPRLQAELLQNIIQDRGLKGIGAFSGGLLEQILNGGNNGSTK